MTETMQPLSYPSTGKIYDAGSTEFYQLLLKSSTAAASDTTAKAETEPTSSPISSNLDEHLKTYASHEGIEPPAAKNHILQRIQKDTKPAEPPSVDPQSASENHKDNAKNNNAEDEYVGIARSYTPAQWRGIEQYRKMLNILEDPFFQYLAS